MSSCWSTSYCTIHQSMPTLGAAHQLSLYPSHACTCAHTDQFLWKKKKKNASFSSEIRPIPRPFLSRISGNFPFYPQARRDDGFTYPIEASDRWRAIFSSLIMEFTCQPIDDYSWINETPSERQQPQQDLCRCGDNTGALSWLVLCASVGSTQAGWGIHGIFDLMCRTTGRSHSFPTVFPSPLFINMNLWHSAWISRKTLILWDPQKCGACPIKTNRTPFWGLPLLYWEWTLPWKLSNQTN